MSVCLPQVTSDKYEPNRSSVDGSGFRPFDMVIPFSFRKGEITGERGSDEMIITVFTFQSTEYLFKYVTKDSVTLVTTPSSLSQVRS